MNNKCDKMTTTKKLPTYIPKVYSFGLCYCGKRSCGMSASPSEKLRQVKLHRIDFAHEVEFTCINGHRNKLII